MPKSGIAALRRTEADAPTVAAPRTSFITRILLPGAIVLSALGMLAYSGRESLRPAIQVHVAPAVMAQDGGLRPAANQAEIVQAPGWIEADPYATWVAALQLGVVKEILFLEGQTVAAGQVVARLIDDDARLALRRAEAALAQARAAQSESEAKERAVQAQALDARESFRRFNEISSSGAVAEGEMIERQQRMAQMDAEVEAAKAAILAASADVEMAGVARDEAQLALTRTEVRAETGGVVMQRVVEPGQRVMLDANNPFAGTVLRLYDPSHLQVRVDVPLADSAKVHVGDEAEIEVEMFSGRAFDGRLTRFVHEANVQKNTVQVKVAILNPAPELKPEMLVKVRIKARGIEPSSGENAQAAPRTAGILLIPRDSVFDVGDSKACAWVLDRQHSTVRKRPLRLGRERAGAIEILDGLRLGDRVIVTPPAALQEGVRVTAVESAPEEPR